MNNSLENKAKFFALYLGVNNIFSGLNSDGSRSLYSVELSNIGYLEHSYLELKPLSSISDEDAIEVAKIACPFLYHTFNSKHFVEREHEHWVSVKHLRNAYSVDIDYRGYIEVYHEDSGYTSNPHMVQAIRKLQELGYYVGDGKEIEYGWVKIKESEVGDV